MNKMLYKNKLFFTLLIFTWGLIAIFVFFQFHREEQFKVEELNAQLQLLNKQMASSQARNESFTQFYDRNKQHFSGLRMTAIQLNGTVIYDSHESDVSSMPNHLNRSEVAGAVKHGKAYTIKRTSASTNDEYFYSASCIDGVIYRSALPYNLTLASILKTDLHFFWIMVLIAVIFSIAGFFVTSRIGRNIKRLKEFAQQAEGGQKIANVKNFPHDELGEISSYVVKLYNKLQISLGEVEEEHKRALFEEREKIRIKRQLTNNINHELKTPICSIQGYLDMVINNNSLDDDKKKDLLVKCFAQAERLRMLMQDLSTITRMDEGSDLIEKADVKLDDIINTVIDDTTMQATEQHIVISTNIDHTLPIKGNYSLLYSIFRNLTDNAIAYSGGRNIFITLKNESETSYNFSFADNGIGVEHDKLEYIFERFYRVDKGRSRKLGGTGLGLSIVKNAIIFHGGAILAREYEKGGLEFIFSLKKQS